MKSVNRMKIIFENGCTYDINAIEFERDEEGRPIDIIIAADEQVLEDLSTNSMLGCNIREVEPWEKFFREASHVGLFARLYPFFIVSKKSI